MGLTRDQVLAEALDAITAADAGLPHARLIDYMQRSEEKMKGLILALPAPKRAIVDKSKLTPIRYDWETPSTWGPGVNVSN